MYGSNRTTCEPAPTMYNFYVRRIFVLWDKSCALAGYMCFQGSKIISSFENYNLHAGICFNWYYNSSKGIVI